MTSFIHQSLILLLGRVDCIDSGMIPVRGYTSHDVAQLCLTGVDAPPQLLGIEQQCGLGPELELLAAELYVCTDTRMA